MQVVLDLDLSQSFVFLPFNDKLPAIASYS